MVCFCGLVNAYLSVCGYIQIILSLFGSLNIHVQKAGPVFSWRISKSKMYMGRTVHIHRKERHKKPSFVNSIVIYLPNLPSSLTLYIPLIAHAPCTTPFKA